MIQRGEEPRLPLKPQLPPFIFQEVLRQYLHRNRPPEAHVCCPVHLPHPPRAECGGDLVVGERLADQSLAPPVFSRCRRLAANVEMWLRPRFYGLGGTATISSSRSPSNCCPGAHPSIRGSARRCRRPRRSSTSRFRPGSPSGLRFFRRRATSRTPRHPASR